jgi:hypothetical protein
VLGWIKDPRSLSNSDGALTSNDSCSGLACLGAAPTAGYLINGSSSLCMQFQGAARVTQRACSGGGSALPQVWSVLSTAEGGQTFRVRTGRAQCIGIPAGDATAGTPAQTQTCLTGSTQADQYQKWQFVRGARLDTSGGNSAVNYFYYQLRNLGSGRCLSSNGSTVPETQIVQARCSAGAVPAGHQQAWAFARR